jgi:hypothetical protein
MSNETLDEKTVRIHSGDGRARRTLASLKTSFGYRPEPPKAVTPDSVTIRGVEESRWELVTGKGEAAVYEQVGTFRRGGG